MKMIKFVTDKKQNIFVVLGAKNKSEALQFVCQQRKIGMFTMQFENKNRECIVKKNKDQYELYWDAEGLKGSYEQGYAFTKMTMSWPN